MHFALAAPRGTWEEGSEHLQSGVRFSLCVAAFAEWRSLVAVQMEGAWVLPSKAVMSGGRVGSSLSGSTWASEGPRQSRTEGLGKSEPTADGARLLGQKGPCPGSGKPLAVALSLTLTG